MNILSDYGYKQLIDEFIETKKESVFEEIVKKLNKKEKDNVQNNLGKIIFLRKKYFLSKTFKENYFI